MIQHQDLASGRWQQMSLVEQLGHVGSEVNRAINWKQKGNQEYTRLAFERALELLDLTLVSGHPASRLKEVARVRAVLVDYFAGDNRFGSTDRLWQNYFLAFAYAAARS